MRDGRALHLAAHAAKRVDDGTLGIVGRHEPVTRAHAALEDVHVTGRLSGCAHHRAAQRRVCLEGNEMQVGVLAGLVAKQRHVEVVLHRVGRDHKVADADARVERARHAGVDHVRCAQDRREHGGAHGGVHLADAAAHDNHVRALERTGHEVHAADGACPGVCHPAHELGDLRLHRPDDANLHACHGPSPTRRLDGHTIPRLPDSGRGAPAYARAPPRCSRTSAPGAGARHDRHAQRTRQARQALEARRAAGKPSASQSAPGSA